MFDSSKDTQRMYVLASTTSTVGGAREGVVESWETALREEARHQRLNSPMHEPPMQ
jgi:hypothetical protein